MLAEPQIEPASAKVDPGIGQVLFHRAAIAREGIEGLRPIQRHLHADPTVVERQSDLDATQLGGMKLHGEHVGAVLDGAPILAATVAVTSAAACAGSAGDSEWLRSTPAICGAACGTDATRGDVAASLATTTGCCFCAGSPDCAGSRSPTAPTGRVGVDVASSARGCAGSGRTVSAGVAVGWSGGVAGVDG